MVPDEVKLKQGNEFLSKNNIDPKDVILQSLREQCIYEAIPKKYKSIWFAYMDELIDSCM